MTLLTVARLNPTKGHTHALAAIKTCVDQGLDIRYRIAGNGPNEQAIRDTIAELNLEDRVELLGSVSEDRVLELLHDADAFVLPSFGLGEAAPVSVMEAMATGLPVVCSIIGGTPDMITTEHDGILTPQQDEAALADAFARLAKDPALRQRLGSAARTTATERFDYRRTANRLLAQVWPDRFTDEAPSTQAPTPELQGAA
ncbi:MAG: glycosyltransferase family 4 protein [Planctomycetota bacterium]